MDYLLRSLKPMDSPNWWGNEELVAAFAGQTTPALYGRLIQLYMNTPPDTGAPLGQPREWHCPSVLNRCDQCIAWINWSDETTALTKEIRRRIRHGETGMMP